MRVKFDEAMNQSNGLIMEEWKAMGTARRLQAENDQLLEALLDFNSQPRVSARQRFDLSVAGSAVRSMTFADAQRTDTIKAPTLAPTEATQQRLHELREQLNSGAITAEQYTQQADQLHNAQVQVQKSLASLEASVPHTTLTDSTSLPDGIDLSETAPGYMSPQHEEEYLLALDQILEDPAFDPHNSQARTLHLGPSQPPLSEKELTIRNPDSVYSWLRKNQPQVFLQDKDVQAHHDNMSEKAAPKSSKKGRQSNIGASGTPGPKEDHDGEDSAAPESKGKAKKGGNDPDDTAYRPKGGSSRPAKRKRPEGEGETKGARKKNRPSAAAVAAAAPPPAG